MPEPFEQPEHKCFLVAALPCLGLRVTVFMVCLASAHQMVAGCRQENIVLVSVVSAPWHTAFGGRARRLLAVRLARLSHGRGAECCSCPAALALPLDASGARHCKPKITTALHACCYIARVRRSEGAATFRPSHAKMNACRGETCCRYKECSRLSNRPRHSWSVAPPQVDSAHLG